MADTADAIKLGALAQTLDALPEGTFSDDRVGLEAVLSLMASAFSDATLGSVGSIEHARDVGERACKALLRLPVTLHSEAAADAIWQVARFNATRRFNAHLVVELARRLIDIGSISGGIDWVRKGRLVSSTAHCFSANYAVAVEEAWAAMKLARTSGSGFGVAAAWNNLGIALNGAGLHQSGLQCFERALTIARASPTKEFQSVLLTAGLNNVSIACICLGDFKRGLAAAAEASLARVGQSSAQVTVLSVTGGCCHVRLLLEAGQIGEARALCDELLQKSRSLGSLGLETDVLLIDGLCRVFEGEVPGGLRQVRQALETVRGLHVELREALLLAIRAHDLAGEITAADMYRRELALHNRLVQQEGMLEQHRSHLRRLQAEEGESPASLERKAEMVERLAITTEMREDPSGLRVFRVGRLSRLLAVQLGWSDPDAEALEVAARLHDIGKISVADDIVTAGRPLTADELQAMRAHCQAGAELLLQTELDNARLAADVAAYHHEAWDGSGYPHGIGGTAIPLAARIVAIADAFAAMTGERPYQPRLDVRQALQQLRAGAGSRHDPTLVPRFVEMVEGLLGSVDDLDSFLAEAADRSPFMQVHRQLAQRLAETRH
jgi:putative two-component system response regulator